VSEGAASFLEACGRRRTPEELATVADTVERIRALLDELAAQLPDDVQPDAPAADWARREP
jgi:hypothetical protein